MISGCAIPEVLDAAHIVARSTGGPDEPRNGVVMRTDLHCLFDAGLLKLNEHGVVNISDSFLDADYRRFHGSIARTSAERV